MEENNEESKEESKEETKEVESTLSTEKSDFASARITLNMYELEAGEKYLIELVKKEGFIGTFE